MPGLMLRLVVVVLSLNGWMLNARAEQGDMVLTRAFVERLEQYVGVGALDAALEGDPCGPKRAVCFDSDTPDDVIDWFSQRMFGGARFNPTTPWGPTAFQPGRTSVPGQPLILTYSFVPDGTLIDDFSGGVDEPSSLFAYMNGIYGSPAVWQPLFQRAIQRWGDFARVTFVYEPADDGARLPDAPGLQNVRGDVRIGGEFVNGPGGVIAYNYFPSFGGDMVIDSFDTFLNDTRLDSIRLRNVVSHESGHGLGFFHSCPRTVSKLMEPAASMIFDGPQHDDIRGVQSLYGDVREPDDGPINEAEQLILTPGVTLTYGGIFDPPAVSNASTLSIERDGQQDWFRLRVLSPLRATITLEPVGLVYDQNTQSCSTEFVSCCRGTFADSRRVADLLFEIFASDGITRIATINATPVGQIERADSFLFQTVGDYFIKVKESDLSVPTQPQLYRLTVSTGAAVLGPRIEIPAGAPTIVEAGRSTTVNLQVFQNEDGIVPGSERVYYSLDNGANFFSAPMTETAQFVGGASYRAVLPAPACSPNLQFYFQVAGELIGVVRLPAEHAPPFVAPVGVLSNIAAYNFNNPADGWTVLNDPALTDGAWSRGVPVYCGRGDPDFDFDGSGQCFLTDNDLANCDSDLEGGPTRLLSPVLDLSSFQDVEVAYARWFMSTAGSGLPDDVFRVLASSDGGANWTTIELVDAPNDPLNPESRGGWVFKRISLAGRIALTSQGRIAFEAADVGSIAQIVEAGVDAVSFTGLRCANPVTCAGDADFNGTVNFNDLTNVLLYFNQIYTPFTGDGDADDTGVVGFNDVTTVLREFGMACN